MLLLQLGLATLYGFWAYPDTTRLRLSQVLVLPPYRCGAGRGRTRGWLQRPVGHCMPGCQHGVGLGVLLALVLTCLSSREAGLGKAMLRVAYDMARARGCIDLTVTLAPLQLHKPCRCAAQACAARTTGLVAAAQPAA